MWREKIRSVHGIGKKEQLTKNEWLAALMLLRGVPSGAAHDLALTIFA